MFKKTFVFLVLIIPLNVFGYNKAPIDVTDLDITKTREILDKNIINSYDLVNLYLDRINAYTDYKAIITINETALDEAKKLDEELQNGNKKGILHGIPIIVKDNIDVQGMPTTAGAKALKDNYPIADAFVIKKLKDAGAIILAKANMSQFAFTSGASISSYGTVKNAYNLDYSSYGSSGGSAVSVAASFSVAALGTDTNSSVRVPAAANNIIGYRPTLGLFSRSGVLPYDPEKDTVGLLTKNIKDSIILTNIINGYDNQDSKSLKENDKELSIYMNDLKGITIGAPKYFIYGDDNNALPENKKSYEPITKMMEESLAKLENAGAKIIYLENYYGYDENYQVSSSYSGYLFCDSFNEYIKGTTGNIRSFTDLNKASEKVYQLDGYMSSCNSSSSKLEKKNEIKSMYLEHFKNIIDKNNLDVIIYPTTANKLLRNSQNGQVNLSAHAASTLSFPAISMPLGFDEGLPYGIEFMAAGGNDELLLNIAALYEKLNSNNEKPTIAPTLYEIDYETSKLVKKYLTKTEEKNNFIINRWINKCLDYFKSYNENDNIIEEAKNLNHEYIIYAILSFLFELIKWIFIIFFSLIILLIVQKKIRRYLRKRRKMKRRCYK